MLQCMDKFGSLSHCFGPYHNATSHANNASAAGQDYGVETYEQASQSH